jgi:putative nucleotidyltransferase with HDIG domain
MLGAIKEKNYFHPFVLWLILLLWYLIFADYFFSIPQSKVDNYITEQSFWLFNQEPKEAREITIIAIDEASRRHLNLKWPWNRSITAGLIRQIASHSPKVIGLDIVFAGKSQPQEDRELISALQSHPHVVLGYVQYKNSQEKPVQDFIDAATAIGFVNKPLHLDLITESRSFNINNQKEIVFSLEVEILISYLGLDKSNIRVNQNGIFLTDELFIPAPQGISSLNYLAHPANLRIIPAYSVLQKKINPLDLRNKIVLVGATDPLIHDEYATPLGVLPGVTIVANSLLTLLSHRFLYSASTAQNVFLSFALGLVVLFINRRFKFLYNTLYTLVLLVFTYLTFVYLRARDFHFAYLSILFSGTAAYIVSNLFKYLNLLYLSNRLRNLAIIDPLTGFYSLRFFLLQLDEKLKSKQDLVFVALRLGDYKRLTLNLNFEQIKSLSRLFGEHLQSQVSEHFKNSIFARISNDTIGIIIQRAKKEEIERYFRAFFLKTKEMDLKLEEEKIRITLQGCLINRSKTQIGKSDDLMSRIDNLFKEIKEDQFLVEELVEVGDQGSKTRYKDILDFIAYDWEERNKDLEQSLREILEVNKRLDQLSRGALMALARAIDAKSEWTAGHSERVTQLALKLGRILGLGKEELDNLYRGGLLHDIGKIGTPAQLINKPSRLTDQEYNVIRQHPGTGLRILEPIEAFADLLPMVGQHHEKFDGSGYPDGLAGEAINFSARIMSVADVFDALSSDRPYRVGLKPDQVLQIIKGDSGSHFDPRVVTALVKALEQDRQKQKDKAGRIQ